MRLDRFITLNLVRPWRSVFRSHADLDTRLPILMYHSISYCDESHLADYFKVCTSPERFRSQLKTLKEAGYSGTDLETGLSKLAAGSLKGERTVAITFDDGFHDFYTEAIPALLENNFTATMYLPTAFIHAQRRKFKEMDCMTWSEVREAQKLGMRFGSHTVHHPRLYDLSWDEIEAELQDSRAELESQLGRTVQSFAYPYAFPETEREFCGRLRDTVVSSGYKNCTTTIVGRVAKGEDPYTLRRLPLNGADDEALLLAKLSGAYDCWMRPAQRSVKHLKRTLTRGYRRNETR